MYHHDIPAELAALPDRFSALIHGREDAVTDEALAEAEAELGLFSDLAGSDLAKARYFYRLELLTELACYIVADAERATAHA